MSDETGVTKPTPMQKAGKDAQKSSQTLGFAAAVIVVWALNEFAGVEVPTLVDQAITAVLVVLATRWGDDA